MNGVTAIAHILKLEGVEWIGCMPSNSLIEAAAAAGIRPIVCRQERTGVHMAVRAQIPILTMILNNETMAIYPDSRFPTATARYQMKKLSGNFADVAQALGAHGERIHQPHEVVAAIRRAVEVTRSGRPAVLEVMIKEEGAASTFKFD